MAEGTPPREGRAVGETLRALTAVLVAGATGGGLAYFSGLTATQLTLPPSVSGTPVHLLVHAAFGAIVGGIFVFLVANTDRRDIIRCLFLAALVGIFWNPALDAARGMIIEKDKQAAIVTGVSEQAESLTQGAAIGGASFSQADFAEFLKSYSAAESTVEVPSLKWQLETDPAVKEVFRSLEAQPWYKDSGELKLRRQFPGVDFDQLAPAQN